MKSIVALAALAAVLATSGCCWPLYEGRYRSHGWWYGQRDGGWYEHDAGRPPPPPPARGYDRRG
jgi:hypothetical protein